MIVGLDHLSFNLKNKETFKKRYCKISKDIRREKN